MSRSVINPSEFYIWAGCMSSGKSQGLLARISDIENVPDKDILLAKPDTDNRSEGYFSRFGNMERNSISIPANNPFKLLSYIRPEHFAVAIDEIHFFHQGIAEVIKELQYRGLNVLAAGLDTDFRGEPFNEMPTLLAIADYVEKTHAVCKYDGCGNYANRTQRLIGGQPAPYESDLVITGDAFGSEKGNHVTYEPRCLNHHKVPRNQ